ncbi:MAG: lamin tail domain-containing protein [Bacteroidota bacterium]
MKKNLFYFVIAISVAIFSSPVNAQSLLAAWHFNGLAAAPNTPLILPCDSGAQDNVATVYLDGTNGSSAWLQATELSSFGGTTLGDNRVPPAATMALSPLNLTANSKSIVFKFSMTGYKDALAIFATRGTGTGFNTHVWEYSTDGSTFTACGNNTANITSTWIKDTVDLRAITALNGATAVYLRVTVSGASGASGNNRFDNFEVTATPTSDMIPPVVNSAWATSLSNVKVVFSEPVDITAENVANYTGLGTLTSAIRLVRLDTVVLTLSTPLTMGVPDTLYINNVQDTSSNHNPMAAQQMFIVIYGAVDIIPPTVLTVTPVSLNTVKVKFSEVVDLVTSQTIANYTGLVGIGSATLTPSADSVILALSTPLIAGVPDTLYIQTVEDTAGNPMATQQMFIIVFGTLDIIPPTALTATPITLSTVKVRFSEVLDPTTAQTIGNYTGLAGIGSATLTASSDSVILSLSTPLISGLPDTLYIQNVEDATGNPMATQQMFVLFLSTSGIPANIVITEIMFNPPESGTDSLEFVEFLNNGTEYVNFGGFNIANAVVYTFPQTVVAPGSYVLLAKDSVKANAFFGNTFYQWTSGSLSNSGEKISLLDASANILDSLTYRTVAPWPTEPNGTGYSLVLCDPLLDNSIGANWTIPVAADFVGIVNAISVYANPGAGCQPVGVNENSFVSNLHIYPNPTTGMLNIENFENGGLLTMYDLFGRLLLSQSIDKSSLQINISGFANGFYIVKLITSNGISEQIKICKQ